MQDENEEALKGNSDLNEEIVKLDELNKLAYEHYYC